MVNTLKSRARLSAAVDGEGFPLLISLNPLPVEDNSGGWEESAQPKQNIICKVVLFQKTQNQEVIFIHIDFVR